MYGRRRCRYIGANHRRKRGPRETPKKICCCVSFFVLCRHTRCGLLLGAFLLQVGRFVVDVLYQFSEHVEQRSSGSVPILLACCMNRFALDRSKNGIVTVLLPLHVFGRSMFSFCGISP